MSSLHHLALFLALTSSCFCNALTIAMDSTNEDARAGIQIHIALPKEAEPVNITCSSGSFVVLAGQDHEWNVPINQADSCNAIWGHSTASFNAFDPNIDIGYAVIYWLAKLDGFFHSFDGVNWDKRANWVH